MTPKTGIEERKEAPAKLDCRSMTGYAMARAEHAGWAIRISVKSVNHRFLDIKLRIPDSMEPYELRLRQAVKNRIHRGHVDLHMNDEHDSLSLAGNSQKRRRPRRHAVPVLQPDIIVVPPSDTRVTTQTRFAPSNATGGSHESPLVLGTQWMSLHLPRPLTQRHRVGLALEAQPRAT